MRIGIIGTGSLGSAIGGLFARHGHEVRFGSRDAARAQAVAAPLKAQGGSYSQAIAASELSFFCIPWEHASGALAQLGDTAGRILVDCSNPETPDGRSLDIGFDQSGAERIAERLPGACLLKAFNHVYAEWLTDDALLRRHVPTVMYCGGDADAKRSLAALLRSCGLDALDSGPLRNARYLEPVAMLMVHLVREQGWGPTGIALQFSRQQPGVPAPP